MMPNKHLNDSLKPKPLISMDKVHVSIKGNKLLEEITLEILPNQIITLVGPNGAGKTTLVKTLLGLIKPTSGNIKRHQILNIGYVPQRIRIEPSLPLSVKKFLLLNKAAAQTTLLKQLESVQALHLLHQSMHNLSGGELQRVLLARALLSQPNLLVLDEPIQGVDLKGQAIFYELIKNIQSQTQSSILLVSHDLHLVMAHTHEVICLNKHICCSGHPEKVSKNPIFLDLFGNQENLPFALYAHHHNHVHALDGSIKTNQITTHQCKNQYPNSDT